MKQKFKLLSAVMLAGISMVTNTIGQNITGAGTNNHVIKFTATGSTAGDSQIQDNGTNVGIGVSPSYKLDVNGDCNIGTAITVGNTNAYKIGGSNALWQRFNSGIPTSLYVGIGTGTLGSYGNIQNTIVGSSAGYYINTAGTANGNTFLGYEAGYNNIQDENTFIGTLSGYTNYSGSENAFLGHCAGRYNYSGNLNTFLGHWAGTYNTDCSNNTAIGAYALVTQSYSGGATYNVAIGDYALTNNQPVASVNSGSSNTAVGSSAGYENTTGSNNLLLGYSSGYYNATGSNNTISGFEAGKGVTGNSFSYNSFYGCQAGHGITTGGENVFMGYASGFNNTTGSNNVSMGYQAGFTNTTGYDNISIGSSAGYSNSTNAHNIAIGVNSLLSSTGLANVAIGTNSLYHNTSGGGNLAIGYDALFTNTSGTSNTACGYEALLNSTGDYNTANGRLSLYLNTTGHDNTGYGTNSLDDNTTGYNNTGCGESALSNNTTGYDNTALGYGANVGSVNLNNSTAIGFNASSTASNDITLGNSTIATIHAAVTTITAISDGRFKTNVTENVKGLEFIKKLRPVTYNLNTEGLEDFIIQNMSDSLKSFHKQGMNFAPSTAVIHSGFIAQEVEQAAQQVGFNSSIVYHPQNDSDPYGLGYAEFVVPLVKAVQELSKTADSLKTKAATKDSTNAAIQAAQQKKINSQDSINTFLQNQINQLVTSMNACCSSQQRSMQLSPAQTTAQQTDVELSNKNICVLDQNSPNPFADQTVINYYLSDNVSHAQIIFWDQSGKLIKTVDLTDKGKGQLNVFANDLTNGMYTYSLIVDGQTIETKKMVKSK